MPANRLIQETSPYLQQHAGNPVDWYPWGEEALALARALGKPILLSIGYSACHWCHVMAHESFANASIARLMNEFFVCIKVDREERPDLDRIYQTAHHFLTRRTGGWPLTMFLTPEQVPFFGGTYFPREPKYGLPGFAELLHRVIEYYQQHDHEIQQQNHALLDALRKSEEVRPATGRIDEQPLAKAMEQLFGQFDSVHGGFGGAPKFPHPPNLEICLRNHARTGNQRALLVAQFSLRQMVEKGLYDQLGGGFYRYSVDEKWTIPHFEKMLYDNAQLLAVCATAARAANGPLFSRILRETGDWVLREMQAPDGAYYSTLDADSEGQEGKFYVWSLAEIDSLLDAEEAVLVKQRFGLEGSANFEGHWHLNIAADIPRISAASGWSENRVTVALSGARQKLWQAREQRIRPGRDEKILTSWNGLMIRGLAAAGRYLDHQPFIDSALRALDFLHARMWRNGRLLATCKDGKAHLNAYLEDHVYLIDGILEVLQARWRTSDLEFALQLAELVLRHFEDPRDGGFFMTSDDHEQLLLRTRSFTDDTTPSGNAVAARVLQRLGYLTGNLTYLQAAERVLRAAWEHLRTMPLGFGGMLSALEEHLYPPRILIIRGDPRRTQAWLPPTGEGPRPAELVFLIPPDAGPLPGLLADKYPIGHKSAREEPVAYLCTGTTCAPPITDAAVLREQLGK